MRGGAPPDFVDGHQHVHLFPIIREVLVSELARRYAPGTVYVRSCAEPMRHCIERGIAVGKALFLAALGRRLRSLAGRAALPMNQGFSGLHDFDDGLPFRQKMRRFLCAMGPRPLIHVHPGYVDAELCAADSLTTPRRAEVDYLASDAFAEDLALTGVSLQRFRDSA